MVTGKKVAQTSELPQQFQGKCCSTTLETEFYHQLDLKESVSSILWIHDWVFI